MTLFMLDTNMVSYMIRGHGNAQRIASSKPSGELCISSLTEGELRYGLELRPEATKRAKAVEDFLLTTETMPFAAREAMCFGRLRAEMERNGKNLQPIDMLIAAHAVSLGATLVTSDAAFRHVPDLTIENWV